MTNIDQIKERINIFTHLARVQQEDISLLIKLAETKEQIKELIVQHRSFVYECDKPAQIASSALRTVSAIADLLEEDAK